MSAIESDKHAFNDPTAKVGTGKAMILKVKSESTYENLAVEVNQDSKYPNVSSELVQSLLGSVFDKYFNEHISEFNHVFSIMMINEEASFMAMAFGGARGLISIAQAIVAKDYDNIPAFDNFAYNCLGSMKWPGILDNL